MGAVMKSSTGSVSGARYTTTVIESAVTPLAVAPPLSFTLAKHSCVKKYGSATWPVLRSQVEGNVRLGSGVHGPADGPEIIKIEEICLRDEGVRAEIAKLELPEGTVVIGDPWIYGTHVLP